MERRQGSPGAYLRIAHWSAAGRLEILADISRGPVRVVQNGRGAELEPRFNELNAAGYRYVCFSFEGLRGLSKEQLLYPRKLIAGAEVQIEHYCLRWSERIASLWKQIVKEGGSKHSRSISAGRCARR